MRNRSTRRRICSILLAALMVLSVFCVTAFAEDSEEDESFVFLEWKNSLSMQNAIIQAKANPGKSYVLEIDKDAELDKTALLPANLSVTFLNCCFTIKEGGILRCYAGADLQDANILVRGTLEIDDCAFFTNSSIQVLDGGSFEGDAVLYVTRVDDTPAGQDYPIEGFDGIDYIVESYDWGTCFTPVSGPDADADVTPEPDPEPEAKDLSAEPTSLKKANNELRRIWFRIRRNLGEFFETFGTLLLIIGIGILSSFKKKKKSGAQKKGSPASGSARAGAARQQPDWRNMAREISQQRAEMVAERGLNKKPSAARRPDPRMKTFTKPDAPCVVCDHTGEDHFARDRENRIKQLDEWLKNGLIDKTEYRIMKQRYERDQ